MKKISTYTDEDVERIKQRSDALFYILHAASKGLFYDETLDEIVDRHKKGGILYGSKQKARDYALDILMGGKYG